MTVRLALVMVVSLGCSAELIELSDVGEVCLLSTAAGTLEVRVIFPVCLSTSCDHSAGSSCSVTRTGNDLVIRSSGAVLRDRDGACTADCSRFRAVCQSEPLEPGEYRVIHGGQTAQATLPRDDYLLLWPGGPSGDAQWWCEHAGR